MFWKRNEPSALLLEKYNTAIAELQLAQEKCAAYARSNALVFHCSERESRELAELRDEVIRLRGTPGVVLEKYVVTGADAEKLAKLQDARYKAAEDRSLELGPRELDYKFWAYARKLGVPEGCAPSFFGDTVEFVKDTLDAPSCVHIHYLTPTK